MLEFIAQTIEMSVIIMLVGISFSIYYLLYQGIKSYRKQRRQKLLLAKSFYDNKK